MLQFDCYSWSWDSYLFGESFCCQFIWFVSSYFFPSSSFTLLWCIPNNVPIKIHGMGYKNIPNWQLKGSFRYLFGQCYCFNRISFVIKHHFTIFSHSKWVHLLQFQMVLWLVFFRLACVNRKTVMEMWDANRNSCRCVQNVQQPLLTSSYF